MTTLASGIWQYVFDPIGAVAIIITIMLNLRYSKWVILNTVAFSCFLLLRDYLPILYWGGQRFTPFYFALSILVWIPIGAMLFAWSHRITKTHLPAEFNMVFFFYSGIALFFRLKGLLVPFLWKYGKKLWLWEPRRYYYGTYTQKNYEDLWQKIKPLHLRWRYQKRSLGYISDRFEAACYETAIKYRHSPDLKKTSLSDYVNLNTSYLSYLSEGFWQKLLRKFGLAKKLPHGLSVIPEKPEDILVYKDADIIETIKRMEEPEPSVWDMFKFSDQMETANNVIDKNIRSQYQAGHHSHHSYNIDSDILEPADILTPNELAKYNALKEDKNFVYRQALPATFRYMSLEEKKDYLLNKQYQDVNKVNAGCALSLAKGFLLLCILIMIIAIMP